MSEKEPESLSPTEWKVMRIVWELGKCAARDVYSVTTEKYGWAHGTTKSFLHRLVDKGHLKTQQVGNSYLYEPITEMKESLIKEAEDLLEKTSGTAAPVVFHLVKNTKLTNQDLMELRSLLKEHEENIKNRKE